MVAAGKVPVDTGVRPGSNPAAAALADENTGAAMSSTEILVYPASITGPERPEVEGKFLQLSWRDQGYLVFAAFELYRYHNQILARFALEHGLTHRWVDAQTLEVNAPQLAVHGGGRFRLNTRQQRLDLWDDSQVYGRFEESGLAASIAAAAHPWRCFTIQIG